MKPRCSTCTLELVLLAAPGHAVMACWRCDSTSHGGNLRFGPPSLPNTINGSFAAAWGDKK